MKGFIFVCGNDGTGKSSVVAQLGEKPNGYLAIERSMKGLKPEWKEIIAQMDTATLKYTFEPRLDLAHSIMYEGKEYPIYWVILDAPAEVLEKRVALRLDRSVWETEKSFSYFRERFREIGAYYGFPLIDTTKCTVEAEAAEIMRIIESGEYDEIRSVRVETLTYADIQERNVETALARALPEDVVDKFDESKFAFHDGFMDDELIKAAKEEKEFKRRLMSRWLVKEGKIEMSKTSVAFEHEGVRVELPQKLYFKQCIEGESKKVFQVMTYSNNQYLRDIVVIILKSTVYSHTKQSTGEIEGLGQIRSKGTRLFLEMMWRNRLAHAYRSVNPFGIIMADYVDTKPVEIVFKKYCEGTDKHSFYGMTSDTSVVLSTGEYIYGPYIRFDWRNPNHTSVKTETNVMLNPYYYLLEEHYGKEKFFEAFLRDGKKAKPFGDRAVCPDILNTLIDVEKTRETAIKMYCAIQAYFDEVGLEAKDGCFLLDKQGKVFWSEVNQDCLRIQARAQHESLDKDIWRTGGSASKELLVKKWSTFNQIIEDYFMAHTMANTELKHYNRYMYQNTVNKILADPRLKITPTYNTIYQKFRYQHEQREVIFTMDLYDGKPSLVKSSHVCDVHSDGDVMKAFQKISICPNVLVVDLNGAFGDPTNNREVIKKLAKSNYIYTGGGLRTLADVEDVLKCSARRVVVSSNTDEIFIKSIPADRLIVELSVDENNIVLIHGRKTNTQTDIFARIKELLALNITVISITFVQSEGHLNGLPRAQITSIMERMPERMQKVYIAGGISTMDDLEFLWSFNRVVPQLGAAIWKEKVLIGDVYVAMTRFDGRGLAPAVIQDCSGIVKGLIWMNAEAIRRTCETHQLHRYSRKAQEVQCKGYTSGNFQSVKQISLDCDSDAMLITVQTSNPLCHTGSFSCFNVQSVIKANLSALIEHIKKRKGLQTYTGQIQQHSGLVLAKVMEEYWEIVCATKKSQVAECSDFLVHFLMYLNSIDENFDDILNELNARRWDPHILTLPSSKHKKLDGHVVVGITSEKYFREPDQFAKEVLGFEIQRPMGRSLKIGYHIVDQPKYKKYFGDNVLNLVPLRPRDMSMMIACGSVDSVITYNTVVVNNPLVYTVRTEIPAPGLRLALLKRKGTLIDIAEWSPAKKAVIATEYPNDVHNFLVGVKKVSEDSFTLTHVAGASESFIVNDTKTNYVMCDSIVDTGATVDANDLEIWEVIRNYGDVRMGLYEAIKSL